MFTAVVPLLDWVLAAGLLYVRATPRLSLRESLLVSLTIATGWLVLGTELLSFFRAIHFWPVLWWWLAPLSVLAFLFLKNRHRRSFPRWPRLSVFDYALLAVIVIVLAWAWTQAWFSPPNNVDSQEYHLQRQVFWQQQGSVEHFPTSNLRQVAMPPLSEFAGLTLMVLTGNDRCHNLVQWLAFVMCLLAVSLIVRRFNRAPTPQLLAALWTATIPLAFLQASTTKNDVIVMLWTCLLAYWVLLFDTSARVRWSHVMLTGLGFGALSLTKGTGIIFGLPIAALAAFFLFRRHLRLAVPALVFVGAIALALNAGHFARNHRAFDSVAPDQPGIHDGPPVGNADFSAGAVVSNLVRAIGSHCVTPSERWNEKLTQAVRDLHVKLGRNIDDPKTTWLPGGRFRAYRFTQDDEDKAAAPAHLLLALTLPLALLWTRRQVSWRAVWPLLLVFLGGCLLFALLLKWQNWHVRLIITLPALLAPVFGWTFGAPRLRYVAPVFAVILPLALVPSLNALPRPMWGPKAIFRADPLQLRCYLHANWPQEYRDLAERIAPLQPRTIGFFTGASSPDYPMQRLLLDRLSPSPRFMIFNAKLQIPGSPELDPDVLIVARSNQQRLQHTATGTWYVAASRMGRYTLFLKQNQTP